MHGAIKIDASATPPSPWARARVHLTYLWRHRRPADLAAPRRFTEFVQVRKLLDRSPLQHLLMDKLAAKALALRVLGEDWAIPVHWTGMLLPDQPPFPFPAILKARHGCNQYAILRDAPDARRWHDLQRSTQRWLKKPYGLWLDEWAYRDVPRGLFAEPLLGNGIDLPVAYKIYVFGGRATHVQVHLDRAHHHRWVLHDRDWRQLVPVPDRPAPPQSLAAMLDAAEALAVGHVFLRVDFYEISGMPLFGEFCLYPGSGLDPCAADWIDVELGDLWRRACATGTRSKNIKSWHRSR